jgi:two-component system KDP operon response regulator KdpE
LLGATSRGSLCHAPWIGPVGASPDELAALINVPQERGAELSARILIVEDEPALLAMLKAALDYGGFANETVGSGKEAIDALGTGQFDAVLLDLGLPDMDGGEILPIVRSLSALPIIVVSGRGTERDKIEALDLGADDYVAKPFLPGELLARIRAALRRSSSPVDRASTRTKAPSLPPLAPGECECFGPLSLEPVGRVLTLGHASVSLSGAEYRVLRLLASRAGATVSRADLRQYLYASDSLADSNVLDVYISRIRGKLRRLLPDEDLIANVRGEGWRLRLPN